MYGFSADPTRESILTKVSQTEIFSRFLNIEVVPGRLIRSPFRNDVKPSCKFGWYSNMLWFKDFSTGQTLNCFTMVMHLRGCDHWEALRIIADEFEIDKLPQVYEYKEPVESGKSKKRDIQVEFGSWTPEMVAYLKSYHLDFQTITTYRVHPVVKVWLDGRLVWRANSWDQAFGYYFGKNGESQRWKIHFFMRKGGTRFICNTNRIIGWVQLPESGDTLVITKSMKDVMCMSMFAVNAISMQGETTLPYDYIIDGLMQRFTRIISLYDYDKTGIASATKLYENHGIKPLFFKNVEQVKDFSDYLKLNGPTKTQRLINHVQTYLDHNQAIHQESVR